MSLQMQILCFFCIAKINYVDTDLILIGNSPIVCIILIEFIY